MLFRLRQALKTASIGRGIQNAESNGAREKALLNRSETPVSLKYAGVVFSAMEHKVPIPLESTNLTSEKSITIGTSPARKGNITLRNGFDRDASKFGTSSVARIRSGAMSTIQFI